MPWKESFVNRVMDAFDGQQVTVKSGVMVVTGKLLGDGSRGGVRCLIVNTAPAALWERWDAAPDRAAREAIDVFSFDEFVPLVRGCDVNGLVGGTKALPGVGPGTTKGT